MDPSDDTKVDPQTTPYGETTQQKDDVTTTTTTSSEAPAVEEKKAEEVATKEAPATQNEEKVNFTIVFKKQNFNVEFGLDRTIGDLRQEVARYVVFNIPSLCCI